MSTKTSLLKRIAQTAVVALVGGLLSIAASPASNAAVQSSISGSCVARAGAGGTIAISWNGDYDSGGAVTASNSVVSYKEIARTAVAGAATNAATVQSAVVTSGLTESSTTRTILPIAKDSLTAGVSTITYQIWSNRASGDAVGTGPSSTSIRNTFTCTIAGAPASFSLSATSASIASGETATFTVTPLDAAGNRTLLWDQALTAGPGESFTVTANSSTATRVNMVSGVPTPDLKAGSLGASYVPVYFRNAGTGGTSSLTSSATLAQSIADNTSPSRTVEGALAATGITNRLTLDASNADTGTAGLLAGSPANGIYAGETLTATGAFTINVSTSGAAGTTTFTIASGSGMSATSATFTLTTQAFGVVNGISFASSATPTVEATAVAGLGIYHPTNVPRTAVAGDLTAPANGTDVTASTTYFLSTATGKTVNLKLHNTGAASTIPVTVAAVTGRTLAAGITAATTNYTTVARTDGTETSTTVTFTATAPIAGDAFQVTYNRAANTPVTLTFIYEAPIVSSTRGTLTLAPVAGTTYKNVTSGSNRIEATVTDQFADVVSGATVRAIVTGRNAQTLTYTTDSAGKATISWTDAGAVLTGSGVTGTTDSVSVTAQSASAAAATTAASYTITYSATLTVTTLTLTNNAPAAGRAVDAAVTFTATALDASGVALSGYPVVFTGNANTFFSSIANTTTAYTNAAGVATAVFEGKTIGTGTVTATSGGKSATSSYTILAGGARTVAVDAATVTMAPGESKRVTATVKDSYGNVVESQALTVTYVGTAGRVASVNGVSAGTGTTDANGVVVIEIASEVAGTGTLTVAFTGGNTSTAVNDNGTARPARVASVTSAITISGTNAMQAAAEAASDAALEAIDAANAATDAANLAAEAADAATVAAEEARDAADAATAAVEALASEVATLMAALKAQITTLANTVAKIAKRVRA